MTEEEKLNHAYLGDGVYAEYIGHAIVLRTGDHRDDRCDNKIYMESNVLENLNRFVEYLNNRGKPQQEEE